MMRILLLSLLLASSASYSLNISEPRLLEPEEKVIATMPEHLDLDGVTGFTNYLYTNKSMSPVEIHLTGHGGDEYAISTLIDAIQTAQRSGRQITGRVIGRAISGHAYIACMLDNVTFAEGSSVTIHRLGSYGSFLGLFSFRDTTPSIENEVVMQQVLDSCVKNEILTKEDKDIINAGYMISYTYTNGGKQRIRNVSSDFGNNRLEQLNEIVEKLLIAVGVLIFIAIAKRI